MVPVLEIRLNGESVRIEEARERIGSVKSKMRLLFNARIVKNTLELGFDEQGLSHLYINHPYWSWEGVFCGLAGADAFELRSNCSNDEVELLPVETRRQYHDDIIEICQSLIGLGLSPSLELTKCTREVFMPLFFFPKSVVIKLGDLANRPLFNAQQIKNLLHRDVMQRELVTSILRPSAAGEKNIGAAGDHALQRNRNVPPILNIVATQEKRIASE